MKSIRISSVFAASSLMVALSPALMVRAEAPIAPGQQDEVRQAKQSVDVALSSQIVSDEEPGQEAQQKVTLELMAADAQVIKGKQYAADTSTETVQTLADGNRIVHHTVSKFYRDAEGRTRREETFGNVDPAHPTPHEVKVFIDDPVSGMAYVLDPGLKTGEKMQGAGKLGEIRNDNDDGSRIMLKTVRDDEVSDQGAPGRMMVKIRDEHSGDPNTFVVQALGEKRDVATEDLGVRNVEGVDCNGTKRTITIPAGSVGNEKPISIVTETWYAPSISAVVQSTTDDPRFGKTTYQLTNVQTSEPAHSLFEPPANFKMDVRR